MKQRRRDPYLVKSIVHATQVLQTFREPGEVLRLRDVVERARLGKGMCFRLLHTLTRCGFLERAGESQYRMAGEARRRNRHRIGYAAQGQDTSFPREVQEGLLAAARREDLEVVVVDNRYQPKVALRNAERLVRERVELVIEFQTDESVAPAIASKYFEADIPLIAIDVPHPGATYFGANNYQAGLLAGRHLARWAQARWFGKVDEVLLLQLDRAGSLVRGRMSGVLAGIREALPESSGYRVVSLDGDGQHDVSRERVRRYLRRSKARRVLVAAANDPSALGAARALQESGRAGQCAIVGQNAEPDARVELRSPGTPLIGSVGYFPERYGDGLVRLALDILARRHTPPALFIRHQLLTQDNVDHLYPNDALLGLPAARAHG